VTSVDDEIKRECGENEQSEKPHASADVLEDFSRKHRRDPV
jgi:hypothetical protein